MRLVVDPIIYQVLYIPGGYIVGFLPSTVGRFLYFWTFENPWWRFCLNHPKSGQIREKVQSQTNDAVTNYSGKKKASEFPTPMNRKNQISWGGNRQLARPWKKKTQNTGKGSIKNWIGPYPNGPYLQEVAIELILRFRFLSGSVDRGVRGITPSFAVNRCRAYFLPIVMQI